MAKRENEFQHELIKELYRRFPGATVLKNDPNFIQGFPDLTIFYGRHWALLEVKKSLHEPYQPNQKDYIDWASRVSFGSMICPENKEEVFDAMERSFQA